MCEAESRYNDISVSAIQFYCSLGISFSRGSSVIDPTRSYLYLFLLRIARSTGSIKAKAFDTHGEKKAGRALGKYVRKQIGR